MGRRKFNTKGKTKRKATREDDASWRMTHLLAASHLLSNDAPSVSRFLMRTSSQISRRINLTMDCITIKRQVCKNCQSLLMPSEPNPMRVRISSKRETHVVVTCGKCGFLRRYLVRSTENCSADHNSNTSKPMSSVAEPEVKTTPIQPRKLEKCGMQ